MYDLLKEFVKPEMLILIPVLYLIGIGLKKSTVADKWIPLYLGAVGIALCFIYIGSTVSLAGLKDVLSALFAAFTQGILCAGTSVYLNQVIKQTGKEE